MIIIIRVCVRICIDVSIRIKLHRIHCYIRCTPCRAIRPKQKVDGHKKKIKSKKGLHSPILLDAVRYISLISNLIRCKLDFYPNVTTLRSSICYRVDRPCLLSVVGKNITEIVPGEPVRLEGVKRKRLAKYCDFGIFEGYISEKVQDMTINH